MFSPAPTSPRRPPDHRGALLGRPRGRDEPPRSSELFHTFRGQTLYTGEMSEEPEEERDEYRHGRPGKLDGDRYLLRGSRLGQARRVGSRVAAERRFGGEAGGGIG